MRAASASALAVVLLAACTVVPPHRFPRSDEREVVVTYELAAGGSATVAVPSSDRDLTVLWLETDPPEVRETFEYGARRLHPVSERLTIRCRYRVYEQRDAEGELLPLRSPETLFPRAQSIRTVWRATSGEPPRAPLPHP